MDEYYEGNLLLCIRLTHALHVREEGLTRGDFVKEDRLETSLARCFTISVDPEHENSKFLITIAACDH